MLNRLPIKTNVTVKGIAEPGVILGYCNNVNYIVGWDQQPTALQGHEQPDGLALVVYHDTVTQQ